MDKFYYDNHTKTLLNAHGMTIGKTSNKLTHFDIDLFEETGIEVNPSFKILGVPITYSDTNKEKIKIKKALFNVDNN
jgi:hypothetical protein